MKSEPYNRIDHMYEMIRDKLEAVLAGKDTPGRLKGSTSIRGAVGILLDRVHETNPTMSHESCKAYLDDDQRFILRLLRERYGWRIRDWQREQEATIGIKA